MGPPWEVVKRHSVIKSAANQLGVMVIAVRFDFREMRV